MAAVMVVAVEKGHQETGSKVTSRAILKVYVTSFPCTTATSRRNTSSLENSSFSHFVSPHIMMYQVGL
jgi:hypothetical protein